MSTPPTNAAAASSHIKLEEECDEKRIYPLYRVLEDEYIYQHEQLPAGYLAAKVEIGTEAEATLRREIAAEIKKEIERELKAERKASGEEETESDEDLSAQVEAELSASYRERRADKQKRFITLVNERFTSELYRHIHDLPEKRTALCFSGGGIRSASFGLGVVQGLARYGLLDKFDYLSTVSGGGYLGGWLSAWIYRERTGPVMAALKNDPPKNKLQPESEPLRHLRNYSSYLNPKLGFLSADTWSLVATIVRNLLLNWLLLIPVILAALALPRLVVVVAQMKSETGARIEWSFWLGTLFGLIAIVYMGASRPSASRPRKISEQPWNTQESFLLLCLLPLSLSAICLSSWWAWRLNAGGTLFPSPWPEFILYGIKLHVAAFILYTIILALKDFKFWTQRWRNSWTHLVWEPLAVVLIGAFWGLLAWWAANVIFYAPAPANSNPMPRTELYAAFAAPTFLCIFLLAVVVFAGIASHLTDDDDREWWARFGAWVLIVAVLWSAFSLLVIFGPVAVMYLGFKTKMILAALGGASGLITILGGLSRKTTAHQERDQEQKGLADYATILAAPFFALALLIAFALAAGLLLKSLAGVDWATLFNNLTWLPGIGWIASQFPSPPLVNWHDEYNLRYDPGQVLNIVHYTPLAVIVLLVLILLFVGIVMSRFINVNKFSLHAMYRNRLIRAYLGASRPQSRRQPNPFTGFDPQDNIPMHLLRGYQKRPGVKKEKKRKLLHVVNMCLNLTSGQNLAWQQRKAETFTVSPLYSGNFMLGYRKSNEYGGKSSIGHGISLGTAVTISGAAASPNMGYHSSPALAFLMTLFNARLGWWLGNPGEAGGGRFPTYDRTGPRLALRPILSEALGQSDNRSPYVYLSDGGHFENLGLYEMVLRRCHLIVVSDGSQDPQSRFEDLAGAVRKIRIDLGIPIDFIGGMPIYPKDDPNPEHKSKYCAVGLIRYSCADQNTKGENAPDGVIIYFKPAITGTEPTDILNYSKTSRDFPHQTTADQFYNEQQLESYRALGSHVVQTVCDLPPRNLPLMDDAADNFIRRAYQQVPPGMQPTELKKRFGIP